jgi:serine/threonine protein kinase
MVIGYDNNRGEWGAWNPLGVTLRQEWGRQNLTAAHQHAVEALRTDPHTLEAGHLLDQIQRDLDRRAKEKQTGYLVGSVPYMSPEQFLGSEIDALCDIWPMASSITNC